MHSNAISVSEARRYGARAVIANSFSAEDLSATVRGLFGGMTSDLVITDILMPERDGFEVLRELRRSRPAVPAIAISGGGAIDSRLYLSVAAQLGVRQTFAKPFDRDEFTGAVAEIAPLDIPVGL